MKITVLSDTHSLHEKVNIGQCDVILHAGDFTGNGSCWHMINFIQWFSKQPAKTKICVAGNHDEYCERNYSLTKKMFEDAGVIYLENESYILPNGMKLFGSPYTPRFMNWYFMHDREDMYDKVWKYMPGDTDVLLTHGPAHNILDKVAKKYANEDPDFHVGCKGLKKRIGEIGTLKYVIFGHIHCGRGRFTKNGVKYVNCSICTEEYEPDNRPYTIEIK